MSPASARPRRSAGRRRPGRRATTVEPGRIAGARRVAVSPSSLGFSEIGVYYPMREEQVPVFETVAREVMPALREAYAGNG